MKLIDEKILDITPKSERNGLGPKGFGWLVPDWMGFVDMSKAGDVHDGMYWIISFMKSKADSMPKAAYLRKLVREDIIEFADYLDWHKHEEARKYADHIFWKNMKILNKTKSPTKTGYYLRKPVMWLYYISVSKLGKYFIK